VTIRSEGPHKIINEFSGVNDLVDDVKLPEDLVSWAHGAFPSDKSRMQRIPGKLVNSTSTHEGMIISIHQLDFQDTNLVVIHTSTVLQTDDDLSTLVSSSSNPFPLDNFI